MNKCSFIGVLGKDPDVKILAGGKKVANFSIAVSEKYTDQSGEKKEITEWVNCVAFDRSASGGLASIFEKYLCKGAKVYVCGKMSTRKWTDQSGAQRSITQINVDEFDFCGGKKKGDDHVYDHAPTAESGFNPYAMPSSSTRSSQEDNNFVDELPF